MPVNEIIRKYNATKFNVRFVQIEKKKAKQTWKRQAARKAKADLEETGRREFEEDWVESGGGYRSCEME